MTMNGSLPSRLTVNVERRHILAGRRSSRCGCPVALAIKEQFPGRRVVVQLDKISIDGADYSTPPAAAEFMGWYDRSTDKAKVAPPPDFVLAKACPECSHPQHPAWACTATVPVSSKTPGGVCRCKGGTGSVGQ